MPAGDLTRPGAGRARPRPSRHPALTEEHYFDYERLFEDGLPRRHHRRSGDDEGGSHTREAPDGARLARRARVRGREGATGATRAAPAPTRRHVPESEPAVARPARSSSGCTLIAPGSGAAAASTVAGLADSEIADLHRPCPPGDRARLRRGQVAGGELRHRRRGRRCTPPGARSSPSRRSSRSHYVIDHVNDLEQMSTRGEFDQRDATGSGCSSACSSVAYFDELRNGILPASIDRSNLDLLGTRNAMPLGGLVALDA